MNARNRFYRETNNGYRVEFFKSSKETGEILGKIVLMELAR